MTKELSQRQQRALEKEFKRTKKFFRYIKKIFHFEHIVKSQKDFRSRKMIQTDVVFTIVFWAFLLRVESFNKLEQMLKHGCFKALFPQRTRMPSIDTIQRTLAKWDIESIENSFKDVLSVIYKNKTFHQGSIDGYVACAIDGTEIITSDTKKCDCCVTMRNEHATRFVHKSNIAMIIGSHSNYVVNHRMLKPKETNADNSISKSEGELTVAKSMLSELPGWIDVIVGDSLYFNAPYIKEVIRNGKHAVIRLEDETRAIHREINFYQQYHTCNDSFKYCKDSVEIEVPYWYKDTDIEDSTVTANDPTKYISVRIYKFVEIIVTNIKGVEKIAFKEVYAGTTDKDMLPKTVWTIIHKRWDIENTCFNQLKSYCNLEHCYTHDSTAIEAILNIMFMVFNISMSYFFRRLKNFKIRFQAGKETIKWQIELIKNEIFALMKLINLFIIDYGYLAIQTE